MARVHQYYGGTGAPLEIAIEPMSVAPAWSAHRARLTAWLADLSVADWDGPTRCEGWSIAALVRHLASGSQFAGYTLHQAAKGDATRLLEGFDSQVTPGAAAELLAGLEPSRLLDSLREYDRRVEDTVAGWSIDDWRRTAEAPPGHVPAFLSLSHFLFDSWVHERDLLLPMAEVPLVEPGEVEISIAYVLGLAGVTTGILEGEGAAADVHVADCGLRIGLDARGDRAIVRPGWAPEGAPVVAGSAGLVLDVATARADPVELAGEAEGRAVFAAFALLLR